MLAGGISFDWNSINCFLRPQALLCDQIAPGYGLTFLFLTSAYRTFGLDGCFYDGEQQHFAFTATVLREVTGLQFDVEHPGCGDSIIEALERALISGYSVIVPANIRHLKYFTSYKKVDQAHYFIVTDIDRANQTVSIFDNLHLTPDNTSTEYGHTKLSEQVFADLVRDYRQLYFDRSDVRSETGACWLLQIRPSPDFDRQDETTLAELMLTEYRGYLRDLDKDRPRVFVDDRHLDRLEGLCEIGRSHKLKPHIRAYLADCNLAAVHLKIMIHILEQIDRDASTELAGYIERYEKNVSARRTKLLVKCLLPDGVSLPEWRDLRAELSELTISLRSTIADLICNVHV